MYGYLVAKKWKKWLKQYSCQRPPALLVLGVDVSVPTVGVEGGGEGEGGVGEGGGDEGERGEGGGGEGGGSEGDIPVVFREGWVHRCIRLDKYVGMGDGEEREWLNKKQLQREQQQLQEQQGQQRGGKNNNKSKKNRTSVSQEKFVYLTNLMDGQTPLQRKVSRVLGKILSGGMALEVKVKSPGLVNGLVRHVVQVGR